VYREAVKHNVIPKEHISDLHHVSKPEITKTYNSLQYCILLRPLLLLACVCTSNRVFHIRNFSKVTHPVVAVFSSALKTRNLFLAISVYVILPAKGIKS
jgi:hypothetical protein